MVMVCTAISSVGAADLDKFVAFIGCFAWYVAAFSYPLLLLISRVFSVPLCYVYPALLHYKACARTRSDKIKDIAMIVFGLIAAAYTTVQTVRVSFVS